MLAEKRRANPAAPPRHGRRVPRPAAQGGVPPRRHPLPRNLVGLAKDLTVPEMEALLLAHQPATEAMAAELAAQRGQAIRAYLVAQKLPVERLFLAAPKSGPGAQSGTACGFEPGDTVSNTP